jgi:predicted acylesterase/phospholipase RssA
MTKALLLFLLVLVAVACSALPVTRYHEPVGHQNKSLTSREDPSPFVNSKLGSVVVGLACSGGGSRAAYLTAAILREIHRSGLRIEIGAERHTHNLLSQIDFVSAVSGGGLSAAYFVANIAELNTDTDPTIWDAYLDKMADNYRRRQWYFLGLLNPVTWLKTLFTAYNRGDIARDDYDKRLYQGKTLADLPDRPALYLNAFDLGNRVRFVLSKHYIDTGFYQPKSWTNRLNAPQDITSENDLVFTRVDPRSVRLADAVYASSAFPFAYPNLALRHFGNKIAFQGNLIFLADGGLVDNSGLVTLLTQMKIEFERSPKSRLVLVIYIDASIDSFSGTSGTIFQRQGIEREYAWQGTYLDHGRTSVEASIATHQDAIFKFLEGTGFIVDDLIQNYPTRLLRTPQTQGIGGRSSWSELFDSKRLLLRPLIIGLRLRDIVDAYYTMWSTYKETGYRDARLQHLFEASGVSSGFDEENWPAATFRVFSDVHNGLGSIKTDFTLGDRDRKLLDLAAYLLVHGKLEPALNAWNKIASAVMERGANP